MRIAHFVSTRDARVCGVMTAATLLARAQALQGHDVYFCISSVKPQTGAEMTWAREVIWLSSRPTPVTMVRNYQAIKSFIMNCQPDVTHFHSVYSINNCLGASLARKFKIPCILSPHGGYLPQIRSRRVYRKRFFEYLFEKRYIEQCSALIAVSAGELLELKALPWNVPIVVCVPNPLPGKESYPEGLPPDRASKKFTLLYCGRIDIENKGLDLAIRALAPLPAAVQSDICLSFLGPCDHLEPLKKLMNEANLKVEVRFHGIKGGAEKDSILRAADMVFLTSRWEAFGYVVVEALSVGTPVIVTDSVPLSALVSKHNSGLVCSVDEISIFHAFEQAYRLTNRERAAMGDRGRNAVLEEFDAAQISEQICALYKEIGDLVKNHNE